MSIAAELTYITILQRFPILTKLGGHRIGTLMIDPASTLLSKRIKRLFSPSSPSASEHDDESAMSSIVTTMTRTRCLILTMSAVNAPIRLTCYALKLGQRTTE